MVNKNIQKCLKVFKMHQRESVYEGAVVVLRTFELYKHVVDKRKLLFEGVNKVTEYCLTDIVFSLAEISSVV